MGANGEFLTRKSTKYMRDKTNDGLGAHLCILRFWGTSPGSSTQYEIPVWVVPTSKAKTILRAGPLYGPFILHVDDRRFSDCHLQRGMRDDMAQKLTKSQAS